MRVLRNFKFQNRKINISRGSGGVRSSALDMFYTKDSTFDFLRKNMFSDFFSSKKIRRKKKISANFGNFETFKITEIPPKKSEIFFGGLFFDEKKSKIYFFLKNQKYYPWCKTYPKQSF